MNKTNIINILVLIIILLVLFFLFIFFKPDLTKADVFNLINALITLIVGGFAIYLYLKQKADRKRDAAKIILQEIRRAENILSLYKKRETYNFDEKIIATNSWGNNIHHFVGDLTDDELDKISELYSTGEYLDSVIKKYSQSVHEVAGKEKSLKREVEILKQLKEQEKNLKETQDFHSLDKTKETISDIKIEIKARKNIYLKLEQRIEDIKGTLNIWGQPVMGVLDKITRSREFIYDSYIGAKLKKIAKLE